MKIKYETNCSEISAEQVYGKMKYSRPCSYKRMLAQIKKDCPKMYDRLGLDYPNPWDTKCRKSDKYYILVWSAMEYFFRIYK
jgi:hypothetical protein